MAVVVNALGETGVILGDDDQQDDEEEYADEGDHEEASHVIDNRHPLCLQFGLEFMVV